MAHMTLREADRVEITVLVDNTSDLLLADSESAKRLKVQPPAAPLAEHGLACLVSAWSGDEKHTILMDTGISGTCMLHNTALLPFSKAAESGSITNRIEDVEAVVLSHGHFDHYYGMFRYFQSIRDKLPLVVHPAAFNERRFWPDTQQTMSMPLLKKQDLEDSGAVVEERRQSSMLAAKYGNVTAASFPLPSGMNSVSLDLKSLITSSNVSQLWISDCRTVSLSGVRES